MKKMTKLITEKNQMFSVNFHFDYYESCNNVYITKETHIKGKKSNITGLRKYCPNDAEPSILTENVFFWSPSRSANVRRNNEKKREVEVSQWLEANSFSDEAIIIDNDGITLKNREHLGLDAHGFFFAKGRQKYYLDSCVIKMKEAEAWVQKGRTGLRLKMKTYRVSRLKRN